ncbi:MAG: hypothetical protein AAF604_01115 [Acidobacteriota bacterium]
MKRWLALLMGALLVSTVVVAAATAFPGDENIIALELEGTGKTLVGYHCGNHVYEWKMFDSTDVLGAQNWLAPKCTPQVAPP